MKLIDYFLNRVTMYRLVLYVLIGYVGIAIVLGFLHILRFSPFSIVYSALFLVSVCYITNKIFAKVFNAPANVESVYITALILSLIITPAQIFDDAIFLGWAGVLAMASKYILTYKMKHVFNPAAIAVVITSLAIGASASWWVGTVSMLPFIVIGGFLIIRKLQFGSLFWSFISTVIVMSLGLSFLQGQNIPFIFKQMVVDSPLIFFSTVMLTEPLTLPPTKDLKILVGMFVGFLFAPQVKILGISFTPELALIGGNVFSYLVSPKEKLLLSLQQKTLIGADIVNFVFTSPKQTTFIPGQYMEWTLQHPHTDSRGNRRYFTLASSPTEKVIHLGVKFSQKGSSFKRALQKLDTNSKVLVGQLAGDFVLPKEKDKKLVFMAGGIGITPFRSMIKYLIDTREKRDIILIYSNKQASEVAYKDVFDEAASLLGIRTIYTLTDKNTQVPEGWPGRLGRVDSSFIEEEIKDYKDRYFYLSGPRTMVEGFEGLLLGIGINSSRIKKDFFPGLA